MQFQRSVRSALTVCLTPGDNPKTVKRGRAATPFLNRACTLQIRDFSFASSEGPPDKQEKVMQTVLEQAELLYKDWAA